MDSVDKVSIILPVFNGEKYLSQSIKSCLSQSYKNIELIVVNDCSTDNSLIIAERFKENDTRVKIYSNNENKGLPFSLNLGHSVAIGKYLTWISDDNYFADNAIEVLVKQINETGADIVFSNFITVDEFNNEVGKYEYNKKRTLFFNNIIGACFLYHREVYERNKGYNDSLHTIEDFDFWLRASKHSKTCYFSDYIYFYRRHSESLSAQLKSNSNGLRSTFEDKVKLVFYNFFEVNRFKSRKHIAKLSYKLFLNHEINVYKFLKEKKGIEIIKLISKYYSGTNLKDEMNSLIRFNIQNYKANQNFKTLFQVLKNNPRLLMGYEKKRSIIIIFKCINVFK